MYTQSTTVTRPQSNMMQQQAERLSWKRERRSEQWEREVREYNARLGFDDDILFLPPSRRQ